MTNVSKLPCKGKFCCRRGLPFVPLRVAYVPNGSGQLPGKLGDSSYANGVFRKLTGNNNQPHKLMLRTITEGYIYIHDPNRTDSPWSCYAATPDGRFKEIPVADSEQPDQQPEFACARVGDNLEASVLGIENAQEATEYVWVGYTRTWWTKATRARIVKDQSLRETCMVTLDVKALHDGAESSDLDAFMQDNVFRLGTTGAKLHEHVLEYMPDAHTALKASAQTTDKTPALRASEADPLAAHLNEKANHHGGIVVALPDIVGMAKDTACWRNISAGELANHQANVAKARPKIVRELILGLKKSMHDSGQAQKWEDRYAPKLDMHTLNQDKAAEAKTLQQFEGVIARASYDWRAVVSAKPFNHIWTAYDIENRACGQALERDFAACVKGSGALAEEKKWWLEGYLAHPDDIANPLWQALAGGNASLLHKVLRVSGTAATLYKNAHDGAQELKKWRDQHRAQGLPRANENTSTIAEVAGSVAPALFAHEAEQAQVLGARLRLILCVRTETFLAPTTIRQTVATTAVMAYEAAWGKPTTQMARRITRSRSAILTQDVSGGYTSGLFADETVLEWDLWLPEEQAAALEHAPAANAASMASEAGAELANPFKAVRAFVGSADAAFVGLFGALALWDLSSAIDSLTEAQGETGKKRAADLKAGVFGVTSGVLAVFATINEVTGKVMAKRVSSDVREHVASRVAKVAGDTAGKAALSATEEVAARVMTRAALWEAGGAVFATAAAWTQGVQDFSKFLDKRSQGDTDAANFYAGASVMMLVSGVASAAPILIASGVTLSAAGATGTLASMVIGAGSALAFIPVAGWIALGIVALVAGIALTYEAITHEDTPLEVWLSRCYYRNSSYEGDVGRAMYPDSKADEVELAAFQQAMFGLRITFEWDDAWIYGKDTLNIRVVMPHFGSNARFAYALQARGGNSRQWMTLENAYSPLSPDPELRPHARKESVSAIPPDQKIIPLSDVIEVEQDMITEYKPGVAVISGKFGINDDYLDHARLKFQYWPDPVRHPGLMMTVGHNGTSFKEIQD